MKLSKKPSRRRVPTAAAICALLPGATIGTLLPTSAHAADYVTIAVQVVEYAKKAYDAYKKVEALFGDKGPSLSAQLDAFKAEIIASIKETRNEELRTQARLVLQNYSILGNRQRTDPSNVILRERTAEMARDLVIRYNEIVQDLDPGDVEFAYQYAPTFNVLLVSYIGLTKMKGEIDPKYPAPWGEYNPTLQLGMQTNFKLVGTRTDGCFDGNPGRGNYTEEEAGTLPLNIRRRAFTNSRLWTKKIANDDVRMYQSSTVNPSVASINLLSAADKAKADAFCDVLVSITCNPGTHECTTFCFTSTAKGSGTYYTQKDPPWLRSAEDHVQPKFDRDAVVKTVRAGMNGLLSVGGGTTGTDGANLNLPKQGKLVDPRVGSCNRSLTVAVNPITVPGRRYPITP